MNTYQTLHTIDDASHITQNQRIRSKHETIQKLIRLFLDNDGDIPIFAELYDQKGYMQGHFHKRDVLEHTKKTLQNYMFFMHTLLQKVQGLQSYTATFIDNIPIHELIMIALIYHDAGKKSIKQVSGYMRGHAAYTIKYQLPAIAQRYKLTPSQYSFIACLIQHHDTPPEQIDTITYHTLLQHNAYPAFLLISLSDIAATQGPALSPDAIDSREDYVTQELQKHFS